MGSRDKLCLNDAELGLLSDLSKEPVVIRSEWLGNPRGTEPNFEPNSQLSPPLFYLLPFKAARNTNPGR